MMMMMMILFELELMIECGVLIQNDDDDDGYHDRR